MLCNNLGLWKWHKWKWKIMPHGWLIIGNALNWNANQIKYSYSNDFLKQAKRMGYSKCQLPEKDGGRVFEDERVRWKSYAKVRWGSNIGLRFLQVQCNANGTNCWKFCSVLNTVYSSCSILKISNNIPINKKYKTLSWSVTTLKDEFSVWEYAIRPCLLVMIFFLQLAHVAVYKAIGIVWQNICGHI